MRQFRAIAAVHFFLASGACLAQPAPDQTSLCALQSKVAAGAHQEVVVSGVYDQGIEETTLMDPACPERRTWVEFDLRKEDNAEALQASLGDLRQAFVVFQGEFHGPRPPNPKLPGALAKAFRPRWGHLSCCDTKIVVHLIREVKPTQQRADGRASGLEANLDVRIAFEIDGTPAKAPDHIEFHDSTGRLVLTEPIRDGAFKAPEISEPLEVRLQFQGRDLAFPEVYPSKFQCGWRVGIDLPPLDRDRMSEGWKGRKPKEVWYIEFSPPDGDGTILEIAVF